MREVRGGYLSSNNDYTAAVESNNRSGSREKSRACLVSSLSSRRILLIDPVPSCAACSLLNLACFIGKVFGLITKCSLNCAAHSTCTIKINC